MADLLLNWRDIAPTTLDDGASVTIETGGVAVDVNFSALDAYATAFTFAADGYVEPEDNLNPNSWFKLFDDVNDDGEPGTASATLDFRASNTELYADSVQNVSFRMNDIDMSATGGDLGEAAASGFQDIVTILAFDADGNAVPVTITPEAGGPSVTGATATGTSETTFTDAAGSVLVTIAGPVSRIEISYANGDLAQQGVTISDINFSTVDIEDAPPVAEDDSATTPEDTAVVIDVLSNDSDPDGDALTVTGATVDIGTVTVNPDNTLRYVPPADYNGPATITYTIEDPAGNSATGEVAVTVEPVNDDPVANPDTATTPEDTAIVIPDPSDNDTDVDGDPLTVTSIGTPTNGTATLNPDGTVTYTPDTGFTGEDTIPYTVDDGNGGTDTGEIIVTVTPDGDDNAAPDAVDDTATTTVNTPVVIPVLANDSDPDGDPITVETAIATNGIATVNPDGTVTFTPDDGFTGEATIGYTITDGDLSDSAIVTVTVGDDTNGGEGRIDTDVFPVSPELQPLDPLNGLDEDPDPEDDRDSIDGTSGADTIETGDDRDTIIASGGDDVVRPGIDDDYVELGGGNDSVFDVQGSDTILGGSGDDTILAGIDTFSDYEGDDPNLPILGFTSDPNKEDGRDSIQGNRGNDLIFTGDDRDTIDGGGENDTIDAGIDDDLVFGGQGDDSIIGGHGSDTLDGGQGDDFIDGSNIPSLELTDDIDTVPENDRDYITGALGNDTLIGGDDDDTLIGGSGNDLLDGGIDEDLLLGGGDDDTLIGGQGADTLNGGDGADSVSGGADRDVIQVAGLREGDDDTVDGGSEGDDYDILDLTGSGEKDVDWRIVNDRPDSNGNGIDGTIEFLDGDGGVTGGFDFFEIEEIVPCFTPGTLIATPQGERLVEDLKIGDRVITRDNGIQQVRWIGRKDLTGHDLARKPHMNPVLIRKGALGNNLPEHDMLVSPNHRVLVANDKTALYFEEREVLVAAKHLTGLDGVDAVEANGVAYIHFMFDQHEVVLSNGAWTESFQPGDYTLKGIGNAQRQEILELFPELEQAEGLRAYGAARRSLKRHEAQLLVG
ncbi:Ig-like domain-containing protein [Thetidibacter halocola]|uniref:Hint domain-containing protein n=1 Tax=Thetidibacter halocola TaxID=2827239 RepID=A0A8J8B6L3_9RHOB|nr:Hint domain-containing protein [Thetidibacter halocola]MBS0122685.1 Hint domain-containing protein [Thetidibacter halocola]